MKTYSFKDIDEDDIPVVAGAMVLENNVEQLRALRKHIKGLPNGMRKEQMHNALVDFLLEKEERLRIAVRILDAKLIERWAELNVETVVKQCPTLFARYAKPDAQYMHWLGHHCTNLDEAAKVRILQGTSTDPAHVFMHDALQRDPTLWDALTPLWFGSKASPLRQAAMDLGWKPNTLAGFFAKPLKANQVHEWGAVLAYPHSTAVVVAVLLQDKPRSIKQLLSNMMGRSGRWPGVEPSCLPLAQANPRDTTLAALLVEKTQYTYVLGEHAPKEALAPHEMEFLRAVVNMHVGVGCLELLLHELEQDRLPGDMLGMQEGIGLPKDTYALPNLV